MYMRMAVVVVIICCSFILETRPGIAATCGWLGVAVSPMTRAFADSLGMADRDLRAARTRRSSRP
jgi:hypothetical protein